MNVTVTLRGRLAEEHREYAGQLTLDDGAVAADVATACGIDPRACVVVVNGSAVRRTTALADGDRTQLYPAQAGG